MNTTPLAKAFTIVELLVVVVGVLVLASLFMPATTGNKQRAERIICVNNLKQIGTGYRVWASDHSEDYPLTATAEQGGLRDRLTNSNPGSHCWTVYATMANELGCDPKILICPDDERRPASHFVIKGTFKHAGNERLRNNTAISYFAGAGAHNDKPNSLLGGDRNLSPGPIPQNDYGFSLKNNQGNDVMIQTNSNLSPVCWSLKMHSRGNEAGAGNILLGDGSVQQVSSKRFQTEFQPFAGVNPLPSSVTQSNQPSHPSFRLIFP